MNESWRLLILGGGLIAAVAILIAAVVLLNDSSDGSEGDDQARNEDTIDDGGAPGAEDVNGGAGGGAAGICLEGTTDRADTSIGPGVDGPDAAPGDQPTDPDTPSTSDPGGNEAPAPDCSSEEAAKECEARATELALADLSVRLVIEVEAITLVSIEDAVWDGCFGIPPAEGEACTDIGILGYKVVLQHADETYEYHTDQGSRALLAP
jgi:hypothetical protein